MRVIGLESNIGSMLYPFQQAGHEVLACHDTRKYLREDNFHINFPNTEIVDKVEHLYDYDDVDVVLSQPSCGKFSPLSRKDRSTYCHYDLESHIAKINPRLFFIESKLDYVDEFTEIPGYHHHYEWVHNWGYGNLQYRRNRLWIMGIRKDVDFKFISNEKEHNKTIKDLLYGEYSGVPLLNEEIPEIQHIFHYRPHFKNRITGERTTMEEDFKQLKEKGKITYIAADGQEKTRIGHCIMPSGNRAISIASGSAPKFHWEFGRPLTSREMARIQGFPDEFSLDGMGLSTQRNAICKSMPQEFIRYLVDLIDGRNIPSRPSKLLATPLKLMVRNRTQSRQI